MKRLSVIALAALLVLALTIPAAAFESQFGGLWRTRAFTQNNFDGSSLGRNDQTRTDTRTRLFYTAKFSDKLSFINQFEMNAAWGQPRTYGQLGADGTDGGTILGPAAATSTGSTVMVKRSFVSLNLAKHNFRVGVQDFNLARGYLSDDDAAGFKAIFRVADNVFLPFIFLKTYDQAGRGRIAGSLADDYDVNAYVIYPTIFLNKTTTLKPHVAHLQSENYSLAETKGTLMNRFPGATKLAAWTAGLELDGKASNITYGATGIFQFGDLTVPAIPAYNNQSKLNFKGYLFDAFGSVAMGPFDVRAKGIYASGNDKEVSRVGFANTNDIKAFFNPGTAGTGASYYWSEIMGLGIMDTAAPTNAPGDKITNLMAFNLGTTYRILPTLRVAADLWYAKTAQDVWMPRLGDYKSDLGTELDVVLTYTIVPNLNLDLVGAYLWAGDVISKVATTADSANPYELGARLQLTF